MRNKPRIRFKGFTEDWEQRKLGSILIEYTEKNPGNENLPVLTSSRQGLTKQEDHFGSVQRHDISDYNVIPLGFCTYRNRSDDKTFTFNINRIVPRGLVSKFYPVFEIKNGNADFITEYLNNNIEIIKLLAVNAVGTSQVVLSLRALRNIEVTFPLKAEQVVIGNFIRKLDIYITLHQRKLEKLKLAKKALLQKLFPKNGSQFPEIRFKGFTDAWEQRKLRNLLEQPITDGPHETPELYNSGIPFISVDAIVDNKIDFTKMRGYISKEYDDICAKKYKPQINDVYLVKSGATIGKVAIVDTYDDFNIWSPLAAMRCGSITNPYFLYILLQTQDLQSQVFNKASHGTQPNLSMRQLEQFTCKVPKIEEQKLISRFLKQLDDVITLHQRKLDKLQDMKKGLLQKMFV